MPMQLFHYGGVARDLFHHAVRHALEKEGWRITHDPLELRIGRRDLYIDLGAELIAAELEGRYIAVEIKTFLGASLVSDFHAALGQFLNYRSVLRRQQPHRQLYLAVPQAVFEDFFQSELVQVALEDHQVDILAYDAQQEVIRWISSNSAKP